MPLECHRDLSRRCTCTSSYLTLQNQEIGSVGLMARPRLTLLPVPASMETPALRLVFKIIHSLKKRHHVEPYMPYDILFHQQIAIKSMKRSRINSLMFHNINTNFCAYCMIFVCIIWLASYQIVEYFTL